MRTHHGQTTPISASSRIKSGDMLDIRLKLVPCSHPPEAQTNVRTQSIADCYLVPTQINYLQEICLAASGPSIRDAAASLRHEGERLYETS